MNQNNPINLISDDEGETHNVTSRSRDIINLISEEEDSGNESPPKPTDKMKSQNPPLSKSAENSQPAALYYSTCAADDCKNSIISREKGALCKKCEMTRKYRSALTASTKKTKTESTARRPSTVGTYNLKVLSGTAVHSPFVKNGVRKEKRAKLPEHRVSVQSLRETSQASSNQSVSKSITSREVNHQGRSHPTVPATSRSNTNFGSESNSDSESLPELSQILPPAKKAKLASSTSTLPTKDLPFIPSASPRAPNPRSKNHSAVQLATLELNIQQRERSVITPAGHLQKVALSSKGKSRAFNRAVEPSVSVTREPVEAKKLEGNLKGLPLLLENERIDLIKSELRKNMSMKPKRFIDQVSPFANMHSIEVPGKDEDLALTSLAAAAGKKNSSVISSVSIPFQETKCLVQRVPPFKNFVFITKNIVAADSKILRFRRFDMLNNQKKSPSQRAREEEDAYDLIIESDLHQKAAILAEDYTTLYKHLPMILEVLNCTEETISESAKKAFAEVFKSQGYDLETLINCRHGTFDVADFLKDKENDDEVENESLHHRESPLRSAFAPTKRRNSLTKVKTDYPDLHKNFTLDADCLFPNLMKKKATTHIRSGDISSLEKTTEHFSTFWTQRFQCGCAGETAENGEIDTDVSLVRHSLALLRQQRCKAPEIDLDGTPPCSSECYRRNVQGDETLWPAEDVEFLKAFISENNNKILACTLKDVLNKDCYDVYAQLAALDKDKKVSTSSTDMPRLPWYDNKQKVLFWKNPEETRGVTDDTDIHRHSKMPKIKPCSHEGFCSDELDGCHPKSLCNKGCLCTEDCHMRFTGCNCADTYGACSSYKCPCRALNFECDPDLCKSCGASEKCHPSHSAYGSCQNVALQYGVHPKLAIGESTFSGWGYGLFASEDIHASAFIGEYVGEVVTQEEAERRGISYEEYFFNLNSEQSIDATKFGNYTRFVNGSFPGDTLINCEARVLSVNGKHRIGFFALDKKIRAGEELFMDYGADYEKKHKLHGGGKKSRKENPKAWKLGNSSGQVAVVLDEEDEEDTLEPVVSREQSSWPESADISPPRPMRRLVRGLRVGFIATGEDESDESDDVPLPRKADALREGEVLDSADDGSSDLGSHQDNDEEEEEEEEVARPKRKRKMPWKFIRY